MTANVLPFHDRFNAKQLFLPNVWRLNPAGSETVHTVTEMLGSGLAKIADTTEKIVKCIPIIWGQRVGVVFRYVSETTHIGDWQFQCTCPSFYQKIVEILPPYLEFTELNKCIPVQ